MHRHTFHNQWLLRLALVHSSAYNYTGSSNLAWLGDSALYLTVSEQLAATYSNAEAGELSIARARLISRETCQQWVLSFLVLFSPRALHAPLLMHVLIPINLCIGGPSSWS